MEHIDWLPEYTSRHGQRADHKEVKELRRIIATNVDPTGLSDEDQALVQKCYEMWEVADGGC